VANSQLEDVLRGLEREVVHAGQEVERVNHERKTAQEGVRGEMEGLEEAWRGGVGRAVEAQVAAEGLRAEAGRARRGGKA
jgi:pre-mRNA-splicing factor SPF27